MPLIPEVEGLPTDLGIHGTIRPESVGHYSSMGCPRLQNPEVEELYDLVVRSTPVTVVDRWEPGGLGGRAG
jgi:lipoprotein-anchoring transpeptidase ErfK/SrfK